MAFYSPRLFLYFSFSFLSHFFHLCSLLSLLFYLFVVHDLLYSSPISTCRRSLHIAGCPSLARRRSLYSLAATSPGRRCLRFALPLTLTGSDLWLSLSHTLGSDLQVVGLYRGSDLGIFWWVCDLVLDGYSLWWWVCWWRRWWSFPFFFFFFFLSALVGGGEWMWWLWVDVEVSFCCDFFFLFLLMVVVVWVVGFWWVVGRWVLWWLLVVWCQRCYEKERDRGERGKIKNYWKIIKKHYLNEMVKKIEVLI